MTVQSENPVSIELGELLELLDALEAQDNHPLENFATLERLLAAGKASSAELISDDHRSDDDPSETVGGVTDTVEPLSSDELVAESPGGREDENPEDEKPEDDKPRAEVENRLAVHIVQGMRKSINGWTL